MQVEINKSFQREKGEKKIRDTKIAVLSEAALIIR